MTARNLNYHVPFGNWTEVLNAETLSSTGPQVPFGKPPPTKLSN